MRRRKRRLTPVQKLKLELQTAAAAHAETCGYVKHLEERNATICKNNQDLERERDMKVTALTRERELSKSLLTQIGKLNERVAWFDGYRSRLREQENLEPLGGPFPTGTAG